MSLLPLLPDLPDAACKGMDGEAWFSKDPEVRDWAIAVCRHCPERAPCYAWALKHRIDGGIWGGRAVYRRRRRRKKPAA